MLADLCSRLTIQQRQLLWVLVDNHQTIGQPALFTENHGGCGISYPNDPQSRCQKAPFTILDLRELARCRLITLVPISRNVFRGQPTQDGISLVEFLRKEKEKIEIATRADPLVIVKNGILADALSYISTRRGSTPREQLVLEAFRDIAVRQGWADFGEFSARVKSHWPPERELETRPCGNASGQPEVEVVPGTETAANASGPGIPPEGTREERLSRFMGEHPGTTLADIKYSARVYSAEFQDWRKGKMKPDSIMSKRIEDVLCGATPLKKKPGKPRTD